MRWRARAWPSDPLAGRAWGCPAPVAEEHEGEGGPGLEDEGGEVGA